MDELQELKDRILSILDSLKEVTQENTRNTLLDLIMKEIEKYDNEKIVIDRNVEMQRKLECISYIIGG